MKILVTGTNGFIGRNIREHLEIQHDVYSPKRLDLNLLDEIAVGQYLALHKFDVIIHCAVKITSLDENIRMFYILEKNSDFYGRLFSLGSGAEYSVDYYYPYMTEDFFGQYVPSDIYGLSKYTIARILEASEKNIYNLRLFGIFGKYEDYKRRFISNNFCRVLGGVPVSINQNMFFDYLYIKDFLKVLDMFINRRSLDFKSYNICTGTAIDLISIGQIICNITGSTEDISIRTPGLKPEYSGNNDRLRREFGEIEFTPLENSIAELYCWFKQLKNDELDQYITSLSI